MSLLLPLLYTPALHAMPEAMLSHDATNGVALCMTITLHGDLQCDVATDLTACFWHTAGGRSTAFH